MKATDMKTTSLTGHNATAMKILESGKNFAIISDTDNKAWESGFADWLMQTYEYENTRSGFRANLLKPKA